MGAFLFFLELEMQKEQHYYEQHMLKALDRPDNSLNDLDFYSRVAQHADERLMMIAESYESVRTGGGVSRRMIEPVHGMLPTDMPLNSYTNHPTRTNHGIALESLALGVKIAIGVGLVAVLGVAIWYMMRAKSHTVSQVKTKRLNAADDLAETVNSANGRIVDTLNRNAEALNEIFNKPPTDSKGRQLTEEERAENGKLVSALLDRAREAAEKLDKSAEVEAVIEANPDLTMLSALMLEGKYRSILDGNPNMVKATDDFLAIIDRNVVAVLTKAVSGTVRSDEDVDRLIEEMNSAGDWKETAKGYHTSIDAWAKANKVTLPGGDYGSVFQAFNKLMEKAGKGTRSRSTKRLSEIISAEQADTAKHSQDKIVQLLAGLETVKAKVEKSGIPEKLSSAARKLMEEWKPVLAMVEGIFHIVSQEIAVLNNTGNIKGATIAKQVKEVRAHLREAKKIVINTTGTASEGAMILDNIDTTSFAAFDKVMQDAMGSK